MQRDEERNASPRPSLRDGKFSIVRGIARVSERERETKRRWRGAKERRRRRE